MKDTDLECCPGSKTPLLFGFDLWIMVSILGGGGTLVLLLIIILITLACRSCKRKAKQQRGKFSLKLSEMRIVSYKDLYWRSVEMNYMN